MPPTFRILCYVCTDAMGHSAGALEMLDEMLDSFDHPEKSSTEQGRAKGKQSCTLLGEMLDSFDQGVVQFKRPITGSACHLKAIPSSSPYLTLATYENEYR